MINFLKNLLNHFLILVSTNSWVVRFAKRYPVVFGFFVNRFKLSRFTGFPLTIGTGILLINAMIFSEIAENIVNAETMVRVDQRFTLFLFKHRSLFMSKSLFVITQMASQKFTIGLAILVSGLLWIFRQKTYILALWLMLAGVGLSIYYGKQVFHRVRPLDVAYYQETSFSFPSGHSTTAMALYGLLTYFLMRHTLDSIKRKLLLLAAVGIILLIGFSRMYLGVHFLSDVAGGYILGSIWLILGITLTEWLNYRKTLLNPIVK